ncbi:MAG: Rieske (2Fe-2S) protein [Ardenticatenaceae bacterium]|nr:Rieske (2Fe-2S) protein [Ardenticatenaceae bacterium]
MTIQEQLSRRDFLKLGLGALSSLALLEVGGASLMYMQPRSLEGEFGGVVAAGMVDSFPLNSVTQFPDGRFYLIRDNSGGFLAVYNRCTHLGCTVNWQTDQQHFFCPCHASSFDIHGDVENPPAPRALDTFPVVITDGQIWVDTTRAQQRDHYEPEQLV